MNRFILIVPICLIALAGAMATPLHTAIDSSDVAAVDSLLKAIPELLEAPSEQGVPPLHYAARQGALPIVRKLIEAGADPRATDGSNGGTALHWAAEGGDCETLDYLISLGLDIQNPDQATFTPLMRAASRGHQPAFDLLIARGARVETGTDLNNGLMGQAAGGGNIEIAKYLLDRGFDINARTPNMSAPIHIAVWQQQPHMVEYLLSRGARLAGVRNRYGSNPMHSTAARNDTAMATILLANGLTVDDSSTQDYSTPLHMASTVGNMEMVRFLVEHGADVNRLDLWGSSPLGWAVGRDQMEAAEYLIGHSAIIDPTSCPERFPGAENITSPLHRAATRSPQMVAFLLEKGANPDSRSTEGDTPLMSSVWSDSIRCMELLLQGGANPDAADETGHTALHRVTQLGKRPQAELLLTGGADPNLADRDGLTPLHVAAITGYDTIAYNLVSAGANINAQDELRHRPLYYAQYHGHEQLADFLKSKGGKGGLKSVASERDLLNRELKDQEAIVWYLSHSGWAIKTHNHLLIFDYFPPNTLLADASLMNGCINPQELSGRNVAVFASHEHGDHSHPSILAWRENIPDIQYFFGVPPEEWDRRESNPPTDLQYTLCRPGDAISQNGIKVRPIKSDIDRGCGFLISVDGLTILHPGDAVDTSRVTPSPYTQTIDSLAQIASSVDLFFFPIRGCGFPDLEAVCKGVDYTISTLHPRVALPMHARNVEYELREYVRDAEQRGAKANYYCVRQPGDRFFYSKGKVKPL
ncbi:ankyrin repeat domain-containing protein [bacterium]|nr:ankyrin repeat domain-containing protein [bacterium]MBU1982819.1 ankyrin repeat domain-containing protein [bacterium]